MTTSHSSAPAPQPTSKLAEQADQARSHRELGVALVWINTAAQLDSAEQKRDTSSAVNSRLLGIIFDAATYSEDLAIKCGNFTKVHGQWLTQMREATAMLLARLTSSAPGNVSTSKEITAAIDTVAFISGHLDTLYRRFVTQSYEAVNLPTPVKEIKLFVETLAVIRKEIVALAPEGTCIDRTVLQRLVTLNHATGNARSHVQCRALSFLTEWDSALFYAEQALRYAGELPTDSDGVYGSAAERTQLQGILVEAQKAVTAHNAHDTKRYLGEATALLTRIGGFRN
ncbi:hypothetical protein KA344_00280 [bacterium]|jgi:hypothetical protein|nr:hypothetical protein [bacterium]